MKKQIGLSLVKFGFAFAVLYWLWQSDRINFSVILKTLHPQYGPILFICILISLATYVGRLHIILKAKDVAQDYWHTWRLSMMGLFFNFTLPGGTSGDVVKVYYLIKDNKDKKASVVGLVVLDRVVGLFGMMLMAFVALLASPKELTSQGDLQIIFSILGIGLITLISLLSFFVYCSKRKGISHPFLDKLLEYKVLKKIYDVAVFIADFKLFLKALVLTFLTQSFAVLVLYVSALAIGYQDLDLVAFFIVAPLGFIITAIPIAPAGVGVGQLAFLALFKIYTGVESDLGPTVVTVYQVLLFMAGLTGLYHYLRWGPVKPLKAQEYQ